MYEKPCLKASICSESSCMAINHSVNQNNLKKWYHVALTLQETKMTLYLDGNFTDLIYPKISINAVTRHKCYIGKSNNPKSAQYVDAAFDDLMIFNRTLNSSEVITVMSLTSFLHLQNPFSSSLINYWPFENDLTDVIAAGNILFSYVE